MTRSDARKEAFRLVFQITAHSDSYPEVVDMFEQNNEAMRKKDKKQYNYIVNAAGSVFKKMNELDEIISKNLKLGWTIDRLSRVTLAILRLCVYEIKYLDDIPSSVSVNEAVEIAKVYDTEEAPAFINGVLSGVLKNIQA